MEANDACAHGQRPGTMGVQTEEEGRPTPITRLMHKKLGRMPLSPADREAGERSARSLILPKQQIQHPHGPYHFRPPQKEAQGYCIMAPFKQGTQSILSYPKQRTLPGDLGNYILQDAALVMEKSCEIFFK